MTIGPWLAKNLYETGNPVYPLAYNLFGGRGWSPELNARFVPAHSPHTFGAAALGQNLLDVIADNDWSSPLLFGLAPLALLVWRKRRLVLGLWLLVGYLFFAWWGFTHRIDRFWVPIIPVVALLAGVGATWTSELAWRWIAGAVIALVLWFNFALIAGNGAFYGTSIEAWEISGYNAWLSDLETITRERCVPVFLVYESSIAQRGQSARRRGRAGLQRPVPRRLQHRVQRFPLQGVVRVPRPGSQGCRSASQASQGDFAETARRRNHAHLCVLGMDSPLSRAGQLRLHRVCRSGAIRSADGRRRPRAASVVRRHEQVGDVGRRGDQPRKPESLRANPCLERTICPSTSPT